MHYNSKKVTEQHRLSRGRLIRLTPSTEPKASDLKYIHDMLFNMFCLIVQFFLSFVDVCMNHLIKLGEVKTHMYENFVNKLLPHGKKY
jgi:hypothetical protein